MNYDEFKAMMAKQKIHRKPRHIESEIQQRCVETFRLKYPNYLCFAIPNGGWRNSFEAANLRREGVLAGVSDLMVVAFNAVLFIEMKRQGSKQRPSQVAFQKAVERLGHTYVVCHSVTEFMMEVERWLKEKYGMTT